MSTRAEKLTFAQSMVTAIETQIADAVGVSSMTTEGFSMTVDPMLEKKLEYWRKQVTRYSRMKSRTSTVDLANSHD